MTLLLTALTVSTWAQDPQTFTLDTVLVAPFEAGHRELLDDGERIRSLIEERLAQQFIILPMAEVATMPAGYSARTYMESCPPGQHTGCAFVVGGHAEAEWVVTGIINEDLEGQVLTVSFVDITNSKVVLEFSANLDGSNDEAFVNGVAGVLDKIISGAAEEQDVRGSMDDPASRAQLKAAQDAMIAAGLTELEESLGDIETNLDIAIEPPKLSRERLDQLEGSEEGAPWERLAMKKDEYRRYRNSQKTLLEWRRMANGRFTRILGRVGFGAGTGPYGQYYDGRYVLDDEDLSVIEVNQFQQVLSKGSGGFDLEAGFGVHPLIEVSGAFALRSSTFEYLIHQEVENTDPDQITVKPSEKQSAQTMMFGARATFAPMPTYAGRPTCSLGVMYWSGSSLTTVVTPPPAITDVGVVSPNRLVVLQLMPGGEVAVAENVVAFLRGVVDLPMAARVQEDHTGVAALATRPEPSRAFAGGVGIQAGLLIRTGPLKNVRADETDFGDDLLFEGEDL